MTMLKVDNDAGVNMIGPLSGYPYRITPYPEARRSPPAQAAWETGFHLEQRLSMRKTWNNW